MRWQNCNDCICRGGCRRPLNPEVGGGPPGAYVFGNKVGQVPHQKYEFVFVTFKSYFYLPGVNLRSAPINLKC